MTLNYRAIVSALLMLVTSASVAVAVPASSGPVAATKAASEPVSEKKADDESSAKEKTESASDEKTASAETAGEAEETPEQPELTRDELRKQNENRGSHHYELSAQYFKNWDLNLAEVELEVAIMYWPDLKIAHRDLCLVSLMNGHPLRALAELMMVIGLGEPIPLTEQERADLNDRALTVHYNEGLKLASKQRWQAAAYEMNVALEYDPEDAVVWRSRAFIYARQGQHEAAKHDYARALQLDPRDPAAHADFADMLSSTGEAEQAIKEMTEATKLAPSAAAFHVDLGWLAEAKGDYEKATQEFRQAIELSPQHAGLWAHLGKILEQQGKSTEAVEAYRQAVAIDPGQNEARQRLEHLQPARS